MKTLFLLLPAFSFLYAQDDKENIHKQLMICITKQDKFALEKLLSNTQKPLLEQALKTTVGIEAPITPTNYAYLCFESASENLRKPYNNDRINDVMIGSLVSLAGITYVVLNPGNSSWLNWPAGGGMAMAGLIYLRDAYYNTGAEFKVARAHEIYKLLEK